MILVLALALSQFLLLAEAEAEMFDFLKRYDVVLSPIVRGRIAMGGSALADIEVYRELFYDGHFVEKVRTSSDGRFRFPENHIRSSNHRKLFGETHITQVITADYQGETYLLWRASTTRTETPAVIQEKLAQLDCDLENAEQLQHFPVRENPEFTHNIRSICRWTSD